MWPFKSRRLQSDLDAVKADRERIRSERNQFAKDASTCARQLERHASELSTIRDEVALHIVAAKHPSSALSDAHSSAIALQEALAAHGIDLRVELARLEGADL